MSDRRAQVRSYARIFKPERRIYSVEGYALPVPGGVSLGWLTWAGGSIVAVIVVSGGSPAPPLLVGAAVGVAAVVSGARASALAAAGTAAVAVKAVGLVLAMLDLPLRLIVVPAAVATLATQATPDGRAAHRYAISWIALRVRPPRRSLGRALPRAGEPRLSRGRLWLMPDWRGAEVPRGRVVGPALIHSRVPLVAREGRALCGRWRRLRAARVETHGAVRRVDVAVGERVELRP